MVQISVIGFDADDTLWQNEQFFKFTQSRFAEMLGNFADEGAIADRLLEAERRNLAYYGFGIKGFTLSMIETAIAVTDGKVDARVIQQILDEGRAMLHHPVEILPHVEETLRRLAADFRLLLITKGDLFDQERKLAQSGLGDYFQGVEIVSDKLTTTYARIFTQYGDGPDHAMMVGNSLKSDIVPAITAGSFGVYVPHQLTWAYEFEEAPRLSSRFFEIAHVGLLPDLLLGLDTYSRIDGK
jgi:putative hydrolase of the HAD superfamily